MLTITMMLTIWCWCWFILWRLLLSKIRWNVSLVPVFQVYHHCHSLFRQNSDINKLNISFSTIIHTWVTISYCKYNCSVCNNCGILHVKVLDVQNEFPKNNNARRNGSLSFYILLQEVDLWPLYWWADTKRKQQFPWNKRYNWVWSLGQKKSCKFSQVIISGYDNIKRQQLCP